MKSHDVGKSAVQYIPEINQERHARVAGALTELFVFAGTDPGTARDDAEAALYLVLREYRPDLFIDRPAHGKYKTPEALADTLKPGEPWFVLLGRDINAVPLLRLYTKLLDDETPPNSCADNMREAVIPMFESYQSARAQEVHSVTGF